MAFESVAIPFIQIGNRRCLTFQQLTKDPYLREFVERFPDSFERDDAKCIMLFVEEPL